MASILTAISNLLYKKNNYINTIISSKITANAMGDSLQSYVENLFIGDTETLTLEQLNEQKEQIFSWLGNQNNIPDLILKNGDAIEIKKIEGIGNLSLNSSYPKQMLSSNSPMITSKCKDCEGINNQWEKDLWYIVGTVNKNKIQYLFFIHGKLYAAENAIYSRIKNMIKCGVTEIENIQFSETKELGRVNKVDPLGITSLRIRGMWSIEHPFNVYNYLPELEKNYDDNKMVVYVIVETSKYLTFENDERKLVEENNKVAVFDKKIKNPDNPVQLIDAKLIKIEV